jgi:hypothetical protein
VPVRPPREGHVYPTLDQKPVDEIGAWIPVPEGEPIVVPNPEPDYSSAPLPAPANPDAPGRLKAGDPRTSAIARRGALAAKAKRQQLKAITGLGVSETSELMTRPEFAEYVEAALAFAKHEIERLARDVGGGTCPPPAAACVIAAARAMLWSSYYAGLCDAKMSMNADTNAKTQLLCAHELCVAEARLRKNKKSSHSKIEEGLAKLGEDDGAD